MLFQRSINVKQEVSHFVFVVNRMRHWYFWWSPNEAFWEFLLNLVRSLQIFFREDVLKAKYKVGHFVVVVVIGKSW